MNKGNQKGITLIALIITIIVILILVAVTVSTVANSGLFDHAKDATNKWADEQDKEANIGDEVDKLIDEHVGDYYVGLDHYWYILLKSKKTDEPTDFQKAYIKFKGETIDITDCIGNDGAAEYRSIWTVTMGEKLEELGYVQDFNELGMTEQEIILIKDGIEYSKKILIEIPC